MGSTVQGILKQNVFSRIIIPFNPIANSCLPSKKYLAPRLGTEPKGKPKIMYYMIQPLVGADDADEPNLKLATRTIAADIYPLDASEVVRIVLGQYLSRPVLLTGY